MADAPLRWRERAAPLPPRAAVGLGPVAAALLGRLRRATPDELRGVEGAASEGALVVLGEASLLPWVDGVVYLGRDPRAPSLLLPTAQEPTLHPALLEGAVARRVGGGFSWSVAVLPSPPRLVVVESPRRLDPRALDALAARVG